MGQARSRASGKAPVPVSSASRWPGLTAWARDPRVWVLAGLFAFAYAVRLGHLAGMASNPSFGVPLMDAAYHDQWARRIAAGDWLGDEVFFRAPLYPYFLGCLYALFGPSYLTVRLVQFALGALTCVLVYLTGKRVGGTAVGLTAGLMAALYGPSLYFEGELQLPVLETLFAAAILLCLSWGLEDSLGAVDGAPAGARRAPWLLTGIALGLFALTRPNILAFLPVLLAYLLLRLGWRAGGRAGLWGLGAMALCILPVTVRNHVVGKDFVLISSQAGLNLYIGNNPQSNGIQAVVPGTRATWWGGYRDTINIAEQKMGRKLQPSEVSAYWTREAVAFARGHPGDWLMLTLRKLVLFWYGHELGNNEEVYAATWFSPVLGALMWRAGPFRFPFGVIGPLALVGVGLAVARKRASLAPAGLFLGVYCATVVAFFVCARYRIPCVPALVLLSAYAAVEIAGSARRREWRAVGVAGLGLILAALLVNHDFYGVGRVDLEKAHTDLAACYQQQRDLGAAEREFRLALAAQPDRPEPKLGLAQCLVQAGRTQKAQGLFAEVLRASPERWEALVGMGDALAREGRDEAAVPYYRRAVAADPMGSEAFARLAACLRRLGRRDEADRVLSEGYHGAPGEELVELEMAEQALEKRDLQQAVDLCRRVLTKAPDSVRARTLLAAAYANLGQPAPAVQLAESVLKTDPNNADALTVLGSCLWQAGRLDPAIGALRRAVAAAPASAEAWSLLATCYAYRKSPREAIDAATKALALDPDNAQARLMRAGSYLDLGRRNEALAECRVLLSKHPNYAPARAMLEQISKPPRG